MGLVEDTVAAAAQAKQDAADALQAGTDAQARVTAAQAQLQQQIDDLKAQLAAGGLTADQTAALTGALADLQAAHATLTGAETTIAAIDAPAAPPPA